MCLHFFYSERKMNVMSSRQKGLTPNLGYIGSALLIMVDFYIRRPSIMFLVKVFILINSKLNKKRCSPRKVDLANSSLRNSSSIVQKNDKHACWIHFMRIIINQNHGMSLTNTFVLLNSLQLMSISSYEPAVYDVEVMAFSKFFSTWVEFTRAMSQEESSFTSTVIPDYDMTNLGRVWTPNVHFRLIYRCRATDKYFLLGVVWKISVNISKCIRTCRYSALVINNMGYIATAI